jgi:thiosulfate reductase cytochrome b subunit
LFGGYPVARGIHLAMMGWIVAFLIVHLALVALVPRTLLSMLAPIAADSETLPAEGSR